MSISDDYQTRFGVHPVPTHVRAAFQALERSPDRPPAEVLAPFNLSTASNSAASVPLNLTASVTNGRLGLRAEGFHAPPCGFPTSWRRS